MTFLIAIILSLLSQIITVYYCKQPFHLSIPFSFISVLIFASCQRFTNPVFYLSYLSWLLILAYMDFKTYTFSSCFFYCGTLFLCFYATFILKVPLFNRVLSVLFFSILLMVLNLSIHGMGQGDIELIGVIAFLFGYHETCLILLLSCLMGMLTKKEKLPFVPCLALSSVLVIYWQIML